MHIRQINTFSAPAFRRIHRPCQLEQFVFPTIYTALLLSPNQLHLLQTQPDISLIILIDPDTYSVGLGQILDFIGLGLK